MATTSEVLKIARAQVGICERPAGSNKQKFGRDYGWNGVYWCAQFVWWIGWKADGKVSRTIAKSASAADIQDLTVKSKGGTWAMKKTKSSVTRKEYLKKAKPGDIVSFDFGAMDAVRDHVGIVDHVSGKEIWCIEGNTSKKGSQSNGGMVCLQPRPYTWICSAVRPKWDGSDTSPWPRDKYTGKLPKLPKRGWFELGDSGDQVKLVQEFLIWAGFSCGKAGADGDYGRLTKAAVRDYQEAAGLFIDGEWGPECQGYAKTLCK